MTIRTATPLDIDPLVALNHHVQSLHAAAHPTLFRSDTPHEEIAAAFQKMIEDPGALWLLAEANEPAGYLYAQFHDRPQTWFRPAHRICNVSHIAVHPDHRRKSIARNLVTALIDEAQKRGFEPIELDVWAFNQQARAAFHRLGFTTFNERMERKNF